METRRYILAIVLCFVVLAVYQMVFMKNPRGAQPQVQAPAAAGPAPVEKAAPAAGETKQEPAPAAVQKFEGVAAAAEETISVGTTLYRAVWSNKGGVCLASELIST